MYLHKIIESLFWGEASYISLRNFFSMNSLLRDKCIFKVNFPIMQNISSLGYCGIGFLNAYVLKMKPIVFAFFNSLTELTITELRIIDSEALLLAQLVKSCLPMQETQDDKTLLAFVLFHFVLQGHICVLFQIVLDFLFLHSNPL